VAEVRLLGSVELWSNGRLVDLGPPKQRAVFVALLLDAGRPVTVDSLVYRVWDETPPIEARNALYAHVMRIRRALASARPGHPGPLGLERAAGGYVLQIDPDQVDALRFRRLISKAYSTDRTDSEQAATLDEALGLWQGVPFAGLSGSWIDRQRDSYDQQYLDAVTAWGRSHLRLGNHGPVIQRMRDETAAHPLAESLTAILMRALYAAGRGQEALDCYAGLRRRLVEELGIDPGDELKLLYQAILRGDAGGVAGTSVSLATPRPAGPPPAQLPLAVPAFAGRRRELAQLDELVALSNQQSATVVISALSGAPGVGKTALAVHWAHQVRSSFPDGQLYVNLHGFDPDESVTDPADAVREFLYALDVPAPRIPTGLPAQSALYRSIMANRRMLIVLDNARDSEQVRPLLPAAKGCLVVVTSRNPLSGLVAAEGAHPLVLDVPPHDEAREMLMCRLGSGRAAPDRAALDAIIASCARLPLALAIVAARAATQPGLDLARIATDLDTGRRLDALAAEEMGTDIRAVFSWSYDTLSSPAARLFRLLGLHCGPDVTMPAAASLASQPVAEIRPLFAELTGAHLLTEYMPGRYSSHDLVRAYAAELAQAHHSEPERRQVIRRIVDHYRHSSWNADRNIDPLREQVPIDDAVAGVVPEKPVGMAQAIAWFVSEQPVLFAAVHLAARERLDSLTWQQCWTIGTYLDRRGLWHDLIRMYEVGLVAASRLGDLRRQAHTLRGIGRALTRLGHYDEARLRMQDALDLHVQLQDERGQGHVQLELTRVAELESDYQEALSRSRAALELYRAVGDELGQARALNNIGWHLAQTDRADQALGYCEQAMALHVRSGNRHGEANTWDSLGYIHQQLHDRAQAVACYQRALDLFTELDDRYYQAEVLIHLGDAHQAAHEPEPARDAWHRALVLLDELGQPAADQVRTRLFAVTS
jgi:DNA-binding SARP family transcriptional activator/tetratricopeptide (TPR) repeat protein